ncbi:MAG: 1,4-alpha-glucan branching protein GlgB [Erysipelotrichaceae bacterium]|nr:1,4-alpha-glucan branching protein GlgB [Erysipelotrichaceae bacterium]
MKRFDRFFAGEETRAYRLFGALKEGEGVRFTVYAPHAHKIALIAAFDNWQEHYLEKIDERGVWSLLISPLEPVHAYRYRIYKNDTQWQERIDPYAYCFERRPSNASCMYDLDYYTFRDEKWLKERRKQDLYKGPLNIYEVHFNAFRKDEGEFLSSYQQLERELPAYIQENHFNAVEFMPVFEHPFDGSWGYQATGFYGVTSRYGTPYDFMSLVDRLHQDKVKVILDVVYAHFVPDEFGLVNYDFQPLYEYPEAHLQSSEWGSRYFNLYSGPVISFLMSSAFFYIDRYHIDGLRFDAVSHFIYHKGNSDLGENVEGQAFVKRLNHALKAEYPDVLLIAEDSSDFPKVTGAVALGSLGYDYKWDLGWMNDTLRYYHMDHEYRKYHHRLINFSMYYFYSERFLLPLSHDEVVHGKQTVIDKMFGTYEEKFSECRNLFVYMFTHPGKKLNFMGNELAMFREFDEKKELDWFLLKYPRHDAFAHFFRDLSEIYLTRPAFNQNDQDPLSFHWIDADNAAQSIFSYYREDDKRCYVVVLNMMPISYEEFTIGVPYAGKYTELINSERGCYNGCDMGNFTPVWAKKKENHGQPYSITIRLAPFAGIIFETGRPKRKTSSIDFQKQV